MMEWKWGLIKKCFNENCEKYFSVKSDDLLQLSHIHQTDGLFGPIHLDIISLGLPVITGSQVYAEI